MSEAAEGFFSQVTDEADGVLETGGHAAEAVAHAVDGDADGTVDSLLSMSESAFGVGTGGISTAAEDAWDLVAAHEGWPSAHDALKEGTQAVGGAMGDGLEHLVGDDQALKAVNAFDDGDVLGGLGHMAEGAADTIGGAVEAAAADIAGAGE